MRMRSELLSWTVEVQAGHFSRFHSPTIDHTTIDLTKKHLQKVAHTCGYTPENACGFLVALLPGLLIPPGNSLLG
jgi:hypothetical protein